MTTGALSSVPIALGSAATHTEEGRAFFQDRLGLYAGWVFVLALGFYVLNVAAAVAMDLSYLIEASALWYVAACLTTGGVWHGRAHHAQ